MMVNFHPNNTNMGGTINESTLDDTSILSDMNEEKENIPICKHCHKSFANYSNLRHHIQIVHLKESKWDCSKCGKICSSKSNLKVHFRTHIRVKPYTCKHCEYDCMHHSSIKDHLSKNHPDKPHTSIEPGYNYNSQAVPEPDEFNAIDFDTAKFVEQQQTQCKQRQSFVVENNGTLKYTQTTTTTTKNMINKPKRFRSDSNLIQNTPPITNPISSSPFPFIPSPLWPFNIYHPSYLPAMMNAIRLSAASQPLIQPTPPLVHPLRMINELEKPSKNDHSHSRQSFEIEGLLNLSMKRKHPTMTQSSDDDDDEEESNDENIEITENS